MHRYPNFDAGKNRGNFAVAHSALLLSFIFFIISFFVTHVYAEPIQIGTSTSPDATGGISARKLFYDTVNNSHWAFWHDGTTIVYAQSLDGETWHNISALPYNTSDFTVSFKEIFGISYIVLATFEGTHDIVVRRGTLSNSAIIFDSEVTVFDGDTNTNSYTNPTIAFDNNNRVWVGAIHYNGNIGFEKYQIRAVRSIVPITNELNAWGSVFSLGRRLDNISSVMILPQINENMYLLQNCHSGNVIGYIFNGDSWSSANSGSDYAWFSLGSNGFSGTVRALTTIGSDLYVAGDFTTAGDNIVANNIAKWDGSSWSALSTGVSAGINALTAIGTDLYATGSFTGAGGIAANRIAKWDGSAWSALGSGLNGTAYSLNSINGSLYVGGSFTTAGDIPAVNIAKWDGSSWSALSTGISSAARALTVIDGMLYVGGDFVTAGGITVNRVAKWDGTAWSALGSGVSASVRALTAIGSDLYAAGDFITAGGIAANRIAKWNGSAWSALSVGLNASAYTLIAIGDTVYVGGDFTTAGGQSVSRIAKWDGVSWSALGSGSSYTVMALSKINDELYVSSHFLIDGGNVENYIAKWSENSWSFVTPSVGGSVTDLVFINNDLYVGGNFTTAGGISANRIAKWDGSAWSTLGSGITGLTGNIAAMASIGTDLYVGGTFSTIGGVSANGIAKWNGAAWFALGSGLNNTVYTLTTIDNNLYVGGSFTTAGGISANRIAKWDGSAWSALSSGVNNAVRSLGSIGSDLYVGGTFTTAGGISANRIAKWDGSAWSALDSGVSSYVYAITSINNELYVGGSFVTAGDSSANRIAKWDGTTWSALGSGVDGTVTAITIIDNNLYAGGSFTIAGNIAANRIAKWDGTTWSALGSGVDGTINSLAVLGNDLYAGGSFVSNINATSFALWSQMSIASVSTTSNVTSVNDLSGNIYTLSTDSTGKVNYRAFNKDSNSWSSQISLVNGEASRSSLSLDSTTGNLYAFWQVSNISYYRKGVPPFELSDWGNAIAIDNNDSTSYNINTATNDGYGGILAVWTDGDASPYNIYSSIAPITHSISGNVLRSGSVFPNVAIFAENFGADTTNSSGDFTLNNIPHRASPTITPTFIGHTFSPHQISLSNLTTNISSQNFSSTINLYSISGTVTDGTTPFANITVNGGALGTTMTGLDGTYSFDSVPYGTSYSITTSKPAYTFTPNPVTGTLTTNTVCNFTGTLNTYTISGTIRRNGIPESGVIINGNDLGNAVVNAEGHFVFANIPYGTIYSLRPTKTDFTFMPQIITGMVLGDITANFTAIPNITDPTDPNNPDDTDTNPISTMTISGQLIDNGEVVADAIVTLTLSDNELSGKPSSDELIQTITPQYKTITDANGYYIFKDIIAGTYSLVAQKNDVILATRVLALESTANNNIGVDIEVMEQTTLAPITYGLWNGYLNMQNILELRNKGEVDLIAEITVYSSDLQAQYFSRRGSDRIIVKPNKQNDIYLNAFANFTSSNYGFVEVSTNHNLFDGAVSYYRPSETTDAQFDYAFTLPFANALTGKSHMLFNTYYPMSGHDSSVYNWLTIVNINDSIFHANVIYYAEDGTMIENKAIRVPPKSRIDIDGGHGTVGANRAGLIELIPQNSDLPYIASIIRYASNYTFAFGQTAKLGVGSERFVPIMNIPSHFSFFEVANTQNARVTLNAAWYDTNGTKLGDITHKISPKGVFHISTEQLLSPNSSGSLVFSSDVPQALVGQMAVYEYNSYSSLIDELTTVECSQSSEAFGTSLLGSYNLYLGMSNWLRVFNTSETRTSLTLHIANQELTMTLNPHARRDIALHELGLPQNSYGTLTITSDLPGAITAQTLRVKTNEFITSAPVR